MSETAAVWAALAPFLVVVWLVQRLPRMRGIGGLLLALVVGLAALLSPWFGHWLPFWTASLGANASVVLVVLLVVGIGERACGWQALRSREWRAAWIFGAVAAFLLYPSALGWGWPNFDSYALGWPWLEWNRSLLLFGPVALTAGCLVWRGNRFGWFLVLAAAAFLLGVQESRNFWDYLLDPLYAVVSLLVAGRMIVRGLRPR